MFVVLWDNDGVLVETEGLYFDVCAAYWPIGASS